MIDSEKLFEAIGEIDEELIERSEKKEKSLPVRCIIGTAKLVAACMAVVLISNIIYEPQKDNKTKDGWQEEPIKTADVIDVQVFNVGATEDGKVTNEYYAISAAIGSIHYNGTSYRIVAGMDVNSADIDKSVDTYHEVNRRTDIFEEEYIQVKLYKLVTMDEGDGVAFTINGQDKYYLAVNVDNMVVSQTD